MKRLPSLSLATVMLGIALSSSAALAQQYNHPPGPPPPGYYHPPGPPHGPPPPGHPGGPGWHQWHEGAYYHGNRYAVNNWHHYGLRPPPPGYQWVQDSGQYVLIGVATGLIASAIVMSQYQ